MSITTVYFLRHCQSQPTSTLANDQWPLSPHGQSQAASLLIPLAALAPDVIFSSPYVRAIQTVQPFADHIGLPVTCHPDLRERHQSQTYREDFDEFMRQSWANRDLKATGCESSHEATIRFVVCVSHLVQTHSGATILVSTHGNVLALFLSWLEPQWGYTHWKQMTFPDLYHVRWNNQAFERRFHRLKLFEEAEEQSSTLP